jgi:hypothetical protein
MFISGSLELPFLDGHIDGKANDTIDQSGHDSHGRDYGSPAQGSDRILVAQDGVILLEGAVGSFGCRSQAMQLAVTFRASGDFQKQAGVLGNGDMGGLTELFAAMGAIPVEFENGRIFELYALLEAGKGKSLRCGIPSVGTRGKVAV